MKDNWKSKILTKKLQCSESIYQARSKNNLCSKFHKKMKKGAILRELEKVQFHLSNWETPYYKNSLDNMLPKYKDIENKVVLDVGCGDGRFTEYLIRKGFKKIIAIDTDLRPLRSLALYLRTKKLNDRVLIIKCSAQNIPIKNNSLDLVLALGVFYYQNIEFEKCIKESARVLKKNAYLINSEPDMEGGLYKSIIFEGLDDLVENYFSKVFKEEKGETKYKFRLFNKNDLIKILNSNGFKVLNTHGLPLLPSILRIKFVRGEISSDDLIKNESKIKKIFDYLDTHGNLSKHIIWKSKNLQ